MLSALSLLAVYITRLGPEELDLLEVVAPHVGIGYEAYEFVAQLLRLAREGQDPAAIAHILQSMIASRLPDYDYEDRLRSLLEFLAEHGEDVIPMCNQLRALPGIEALFNNLTQG